jgi:type IV fimbrial biogenesis protein FimT
MESKGFTLLELLTVFAIAGILALIAIPSYTEYVQNSRISALTNKFTMALAFARSEAITSSVPVTICAASDVSGTVCGSNTDWGNGWIIFTDSNGTGVIANLADRLQVEQDLADGTQIVSSQSGITYGSNGFLQSGGGTFTLSASGCSGDFGRTITITSTGRPHVVKTAC